jgi:lysyl-tRNA synthetase class I
VSDIREILVTCPCCGKVHSVEAKRIREEKLVKVECGATLGSAGLMRRLEEAEKKAEELKGRLYRL